MNSFEGQPKLGSINPEITQRFVADIIERGEKGIYRVGVKVGDITIPVDIYPGVFPPKSDYSVSSRSVYKAFGDLSGKTVADIGSGSGIESIVATLAGAEHVDATDISKTAVECTRHNVELNSLGGKISVYEGSLFDHIPKRKYDLIIANLPIVNFQPDKDSDITRALYDPGFELHRKMLSQAAGFLSEGGIVTFTHANLQSGKTENPEKDFEELQAVINGAGYDIIEKDRTQALGHDWVNYKIKLKTKE